MPDPNGTCNPKRVSSSLKYRKSNRKSELKSTVHSVTGHHRVALNRCGEFISVLEPDDTLRSAGGVGVIGGRGRFRREVRGESTGASYTTGDDETARR